MTLCDYLTVPSCRRADRSVSIWLRVFKHMLSHTRRWQGCTARASHKNAIFAFIMMQKSTKRNKLYVEHDGIICFPFLSFFSFTNNTLFKCQNGSGSNQNILYNLLLPFQLHKSQNEKPDFFFSDITYYWFVLHNIPVSQYPVIKNGTIQLFIAGTLENDSILIRAKAKIYLQSALRIKDILEQQQQKKNMHARENKVLDVFGVKNS